jgi:hypothetical protein
MDTQVIKGNYIDKLVTDIIQIVNAYRQASGQSSNICEKKPTYYMLHSKSVPAIVLDRQCSNGY